jgi:ABC-type multidrug transport system fused ATPase/permease subunit
MDEATSELDARTERVLADVLRREFVACTVVVVAHREETLRDLDLVVVLDRGRVVEVGEPGLLMRTQGSAFARLFGGAEGEME